MLVIDLWSIERMYWIFSPRASKLFATDPAIDAIKADIAKSGEPGRVWTEERLGGQIVRDANFVGDGLMSHGLRLVGVYHGNELDMYDRLTGGDTRRARPSCLRSSGGRRTSGTSTRARATPRSRTSRRS